MICRLCLNTLDEQNAVLLFAAASDSDSDNTNELKTIPENYLVQLISTHLYLCLSRDDAISTSICTECCAQLQSFHNFWMLVEHKQTTLCSQFLEIDCDVNWSEEGDVEQQTRAGHDYEQQEPEPEPEPEPDPETEVAVYDAIVKEETEFHDTYLKVDHKAAAAHKFPCMFCEKSFKMRRYLEEHVATHTGDRPIACAHCNMAFRCRSNMYTHVKTKHTTEWQKARADRESAKVNNSSSNNNVQIQRGVNGDNAKCMDVQPTVPPSELASNEEAPSPAPAPATAKPAPAPAVDKSEPMEAINLTVAKTCPTLAKRVTRSSRRKTHSPKKVQHTQRSGSEDSSSDELHGKRLKTEQQTCKENELMLANYNAVAAVVAAASQQQRLCATILQQQQQHEQLLQLNTSSSTSTSTTGTAAAAVAAAAFAALNSQNSSSPAVASASAPIAPAEPYTCSICGQQLRNQRALNNHLQNSHSTPPAPACPPSLPVSICTSCGEVANPNHRCLSKAKYACDVCGKSFKMKRYLEEHFATHTGVKLHTCAFCPTEFRSKSNMYHHTKRKHKLEWERSRASRNAAKTGVAEQQQEQPQEAAATNS